MLVFKLFIHKNQKAYSFNHSIDFVNLSKFRNFKIFYSCLSKNECICVCLLGVLACVCVCIRDVNSYVNSSVKEEMSSTIIC